MEEVYLSDKNTGIPNSLPTATKQDEIADKLNDVVTINTATQDTIGATNSLLEEVKVLITLPQDLSVTASPTFAGATLSGLTPSRLVFTDVGGGLVSGVTDITTAQLEELSDGSETALHSHASSGAMSYTGAGDVSSFDFTLTYFTRDNAYHDWDLSSIVGVGSRLVLLEISFDASTANEELWISTKGYTNNKNAFHRKQYDHTRPQYFSCWVLTDASGVIQYKMTVGTYTTMNVVVRGWLAV